MTSPRPVPIFDGHNDADAGGGCGRNSAINRKISWNICRGMATSAICKAT